MHLQDFAREMIKEAGFLRWMTTKKIRPKWFGSQAQPAKDILGAAKGKLSKEQEDNLRQIASGTKRPDARKIIRKASKEHDARKFSPTKPLALGAIGVGTIAGSRAVSDPRYNARLTDRSPQLTQDPSRVMY